MKSIYFATAILLMSSLVKGQDLTLPKLSPLTQLYLIKTKERTDIRLLEYVYRKGNDGKDYIAALLKVQPGFSGEALRSLGVKIGTKAGTIWTAQVPVDAVVSLTQVKGIAYVQLDEPAVALLDTARVVTRVDSVQQGHGLQMPYSGKGVVMGIIDVGFDYAHPAFFDTTGTGYRVKKVWEQKKAGTAPTGYSYGNEMTDSNVIWSAATDAALTHGTHVAGIASGGGFENHLSGNNQRYRGVAYASDLVFVGITPPPGQWTNTGSADMVDGMKYIYDYATSQGKPAVANLSWGCSIGPHDGTSLFNQACDNLTGSGKIFVCSGGNNGDRKIHVQKTFTATDTNVRTFVSVPQTPIGRRTWIDIWGSNRKPSV